METRLPLEPNGISRRRKRAVVDGHRTEQARQRLQRLATVGLIDAKGNDGGARRFADRWSCSRSHRRVRDPDLPLQEIMHYGKRSVTSRTSWMLGMIRLRARITPFCDIASRLGTACEISGQGKIVIVEAYAARIGLIVETVAEVPTVAEDRIEPATCRSWPAADRRTPGLSDPDPAAATTRRHRRDRYRRPTARQSTPHASPDRSRPADRTPRPHRAQTMTR